MRPDINTVVIGQSLQYQIIQLEEGNLDEPHQNELLQLEEGCHDDSQQDQLLQLEEGCHDDPQSDQLLQLEEGCHDDPQQDQLLQLEEGCHDDPHQKYHTTQHQLGAAIAQIPGAAAHIAMNVKHGTVSVRTLKCRPTQIVVEYNILWDKGTRTSCGSCICKAHYNQQKWQIEVIIINPVNSVFPVNTFLR